MERSELSQIADLISDEAAAIIQWQRVLAGIHEELDRNAFRPFEQDILYSEHYGQMPSEPRKFEFNGVLIISRILHQTGLGLRDIRGADHLYEIEGEKYALIQYKKSDEQAERVKNDRAQLDALLENCPSVCMYKKNPPRRIPGRINGFCGCWYRVDTNKEPKFFHACEAKLIYGDKQSVSSSEFQLGISRGTFLDLFSGCHIGALTRFRKSGHYTSELLERRHIIFETRQIGRWST